MNASNISQMDKLIKLSHFTYFIEILCIWRSV